MALTDKSVGTDYSSTDYLTVDIGGDVIAFGDSSRFQADSYQVGYTAGKKFYFSEIPASGDSYGGGSYVHNEIVKVDMDVSEVTTIADVKTIFRGRIREVPRTGENNKGRVQYVAYGNQLIANEISVCYTHSTSVTTATSITTTIVVNYFKLDCAEADPDPVMLLEVIEGLFVEYEPELTAREISIDRDFSVVNDKALPENESLTYRGNFVQIIQNLLQQHDPGVVLRFNDEEDKWHALRPADSPVITMDVSDINLQSHEVTESTEGRYTAIELKEPPVIFDNNTLLSVPVANAWDPALQQYWNTPLASENNTAMQAVYRLFAAGTVGNHPPVNNKGYINVPRPILTGHTQIGVINPHVEADDTDAKDQGNKVKADEKLPNAGADKPITKRTEEVRLELSDGDDYDFESIFVLTTAHTVSWYVPADVFFCHGYLAFFANEPVWYDGNALAPGDAFSMGTLGKLSGANGLYFSSFPTTITTVVRYPESGFEGTAYDPYGIENVLREQVQPGEATVENAERKLKLHKDVVVSGTLPIEGDVLPNFIELGTGVLLSDTQSKLYDSPENRLTALNSVVGYVTDFTYQFGKRNSNSLNFTSDILGVLP